MALLSRLMTLDKALPAQLKALPEQVVRQLVLKIVATELRRVDVRSLVCLHAMGVVRGKEKPSSELMEQLEQLVEHYDSKYFDASDQDEAGVAEQGEVAAINFARARAVAALDCLVRGEFQESIYEACHVDATPDTVLTQLKTDLKSVAPLRSRRNR